MIVEQPFGGRRDRGTGLDVRSRCAIDAQDFTLVFLVPGGEVEIHQPGQFGRTVQRERRGALPQLLDREIGRSNGIVVVDLLGFEVTRWDMQRHEE